jgi:hypothetical protein
VLSDHLRGHLARRHLQHLDRLAVMQVVADKLAAPVVIYATDDRW